MSAPDHIIKEILLRTQPHPEPRQPTMHLALQLLNTLERVNILETGTTRGPNEGVATIVFANFILCSIEQKSKLGKLWTVDLDHDSIQNIELTLKKWKIEVECVESDSVKFLNGFTENVDLLYLDSLADHVRDPQTMQLVRAGGREHQLAEAKAAFDAGIVHEKTIILLDDQRIRSFNMFNGNDDNGKGIMSIPFLRKKGWSIINETGCQAVLINEKAWDSALVNNMIDFVEGRILSQSPFQW